MVYRADQEIEAVYFPEAELFIRRSPTADCAPAYYRGKFTG
jgi:hypothetical protein